MCNRARQLDERVSLTIQTRAPECMSLRMAVNRERRAPASRTPCGPIMSMYSRSSCGTENSSCMPGTGAFIGSKTA
jgi:hypothetical protein